jgi:GNAT superfamily N-acetyltransferase
MFTGGKACQRVQAPHPMGILSFCGYAAPAHLFPPPRAAIRCRVALASQGRDASRVRRSDVGNWNEDQQRSFAARDLRSPSLRIIVVAEEGDAGAIDVARRGSEWFLGRLELLPRLQRRGLGRAIISDLQREAALAGLPIRLQVLRVNPAQSLYRRLGFEEVGVTTSHLLMSWTPGPRNLKTASPPGRIA